MKDQKDIFDHIRDNQDKLEERPSAQLWDRLESRLDETEVQPPTQRRTLYRRLSSIAAVLALFGLLSLVNLLLQQRRDQNTSAVATAATPSQWEDFSNPPMASNETGWHKYADFQKRINTRPYIPEGEPHKKLVAQKHYSTVEGYASVATKKAKKLSKTHTAQAATATETIDDKMLRPASAKPSNEHHQLSTAEPQMAMAFDPIETNDNGASEFSTYSNQKPLTDPMAKKRMRSSSTPQKRSQDQTLAGKMAQTTATAMDKVDLRTFQWLLGEWETDMATNQSVEQWVWQDEQTLMGHGQLLDGNRLLFSEQMLIQKIDDQLYYHLSLDDSGKSIVYQLISHTDEESIFENQQVIFPQQVILRRHASGHYSTILQNKAPAQINRAQQLFLVQRNVIHTEQVERTMRRRSR
ncbi:MAG: DUF6265 family protein [Bacteroidota bacterium]